MDFSGAQHLFDGYGDDHLVHGQPPDQAQFLDPLHIELVPFAKRVKPQTVVPDGVKQIARMQNQSFSVSERSGSCGRHRADGRVFVGTREPLDPCPENRGLRTAKHLALSRVLVAAVKF